MSMVGVYRRITSAQLAELLRKPDSIRTFLDVDEEVLTSPDERFLEVDKAWHGVHFLLTGDPWGGEPPLVNVVLGGKELGKVDLGYGPARYLTPEEVREVAEALGRVSHSDLHARFNSTKFSGAKIYPDIWDEGDSAFDYLMEYYIELVKFFQRVAASGEAVLFWVE